MKKNKIALISLVILLLPVAALAQYGDNPPRGAVGDIGYLLQKIENFIWIVFATLAVICFIAAGILFMTAQGSPEKVKAARDAFMWGVVGVIVGVIAYSIVNIIVRFI